mgnify:CR=1 FL=1
MRIIDELKSLKTDIEAGQPASSRVDRIKQQLPVRYRTHILCTWHQYLKTRDQHSIVDAIEQIIDELKPDPRETSPPSPGGRLNRNSVPTS